MYLDKEIAALKINMKFADQQETSVSQQGVHWHINHSLRVISGICSMLKQSEPKDYKPKFSFTKLGIMLTGKIPRGKAKAPKKVAPEDNIDPKETQELFDKVEHQLKTLEKLDNKHFFSHHIFGDLNLKKSVKFMGIHTHHHMKIIKDIVGKAK